MRSREIRAASSSGEAPERCISPQACGALGKDQRAGVAALLRPVEDVAEKVAQRAQEGVVRGLCGLLREGEHGLRDDRRLGDDPAGGDALDRVCKGDDERVAVDEGGTLEPLDVRDKARRALEVGRRELAARDRPRDVARVLAGDEPP